MFSARIEERQIVGVKKTLETNLKSNCFKVWVILHEPDAAGGALAVISTEDEQFQEVDLSIGWLRNFDLHNPDTVRHVIKATAARCGEPTAVIEAFRRHGMGIGTVRDLLG